MGDCFVSDCFVKVTSDLAHFGVEPGLGSAQQSLTMKYVSRDRLLDDPRKGSPERRMSLK